MPSSGGERLSSQQQRTDIARLPQTARTNDSTLVGFAESRGAYLQQPLGNAKGAAMIDRPLKKLKAAGYYYRLGVAWLTEASSHRARPVACASVRL